MIIKKNKYHLVIVVILLISLISLSNLFASEEPPFSKIVFYVA